MKPASDIPCVAFEGDRCIATGDLRDVARAAKRTLDRRKDASVLVFDGMTGGPIDLDFRGTVEDVLARLPDMADTPGIGNGWHSNQAAPRLHCADWSTRQDAPTRTRTGSGTRRK